MPILALPQVAQLFGHDVGVKIVRSGGELVEELYAVRDGKQTLVLVSPTDPSITKLSGGSVISAIQGAGSGLFTRPPSFAFKDVSVIGNTIKLTSSDGQWNFVKTIKVPATGQGIEIHVSATSDAADPQIRYLLTSYAFAPGTPDTTFAPAFRPADGQVIGDHFFRAPVVMAQKGAVSAALMPDLDVLADNRPIPTIIDLDCKNGVIKEPLLSYGFADYRLVGHVYFSNDASMVRPVPGDLQLGMTVLLNAATPKNAGTAKPTKMLWDRYGSHYFDKILPQAMPFAQYAEVCYPAAFNEKMTGGWFEKTIDGQVCGGIPAGWGLNDGWVSWQGWFNQLRSAWGVRWFGKKLNHPEWVDKADKMLNFALAAPMKDGAVPTTYLSRTNEWKGSLITPTKDCYYDLTNMAWKGISMLKWLEFDDCPRRDEINKQLAAMAQMMLAHQNADGSFPTWLDTNLKVVPVLDHSAQSALPTWFLSAWAKQQMSTELAKKSMPAIRKSADFLLREVVPKALYYDFETFFSCSPKACFQRDGKIDDIQMWDMHTMQAPQNTLSMQWTAEALNSVDAVNTQSLIALDQMALYQNVWPISYRKVAYTYGGFGVQNSDGEYNDARQAQFGVSLCDFAVQLNRKDYFERGVAAIRASLTLINHPLHEQLGIYPNPNYPLGLEPENDGHGGTDQQDGRTGFDWGEGSGLASAAMIMDKYGSTYKDPHGWNVIIDPEFKTLPEGRWPAQPPMTMDKALDMTNWRMHGWSFDGTFLAWPTMSRRYNFGNGTTPFIGTAEDGRTGYDDTFVGTILSPKFVVDRDQIKILVGGGKGDGTSVELIDESGKVIYAERGHESEMMDPRTWDVSKYRGKTLQIRINDQEKGGWGHINVGF